MFILFYLQWHALDFKEHSPKRKLKIKKIESFFYFLGTQNGQNKFCVLKKGKHEFLFLLYTNLAHQTGRVSIMLSLKNHSTLLYSIWPVTEEEREVSHQEM